MEYSKDSTNLLFETIRKELNSIIEDSPSTASSVTAAATVSETHMHNANRRHEKPVSSKRQHPDNNLPNTEQPVIEDPDTETNKHAAFLRSQACHSIDKDLQNMQLNLRQSYELFQTVGDKFETINFGTLKNRIKDLHLSAKNSAESKATNLELAGLFEKSYAEKRLNTLTNEMSEKFRKHPGEFGDIPELSAFFKACSQLQHGLEQLKRQRSEVSDLAKRVNWASEVSYDRIDEIRLAMGENLGKN